MWRLRSASSVMLLCEACLPEAGGSPATAGKLRSTRAAPVAETGAELDAEEERAEAPEEEVWGAGEEDEDAWADEELASADLNSKDSAEEAVGRGAGAVLAVMDKREVVEKEAVKTEALPPPAPPASAPAPEPEKKGKKMMRGKAAFAKTAAPPPPAKKAPARMVLPAEPEAPQDLTASPMKKLLDYGRLRLAAPASPRRGTLQAVTSEEAWFEMLARLEVTVEFDVLAVVGLATSTAQEAASVSPPAGYSPPQTVEGFDYAYPTDAPVDVLSDDQFRSIPVTEKDAKVDVRFVVVPRESGDAYRFAELENPLDAPLLPGPADIYIGGDFLLTAPLRLVAPRGRAGIGLGVEQAIKVARNARFEEEPSGVLGGRLDLKHEITVEVANNLKRPARVEVRERVPVAREGDDDVGVKVTGASPPWQEYEQEPGEAPPGEALLKGGYRWEVTLEPGAKKELSAAYVISISSKNEIVGGNRREA